ncbi:MAG: hypothetical protein ABUU24_03540 [Variovorax sp.]
MGMKRRNPVELYRDGPSVTPSAQMDARILAASRTSQSATRPRRQWLVAGAMAVAVVATFYVRFATMPVPHYEASDFGREEGLARDWLMNFDLQQPTGPGSQEGLP